jgi:hypothetical protein
VSTISDAEAGGVEEIELKETALESKVDSARKNVRSKEQGGI